MSTDVVRRVEYTTADLDSARDRLQRQYGARMGTGTGPVDGPVLSLREIRTDRFRTAEVDLHPALEFRVRGQAELVVTALAQGEVEIDEGRFSDRHRAGEVLIGNWPGARFRSRTQDVRALVVAIHFQLLGDLAGMEPDSVSGLRFGSRTPTNAGAAARWLSTARHVHSMLADTEFPVSPLVAGAAGRLLGAATLAAFPNNAPSDATATERHDSRPGVVRRAVAFMESYADTDITLSDIAVAANVSVRTVQLAFRRHLGTTPMAHLRTVRMALAHHDLRDADPEDGQTVASIAARWGFTNPGRFAALYRAAYGVPPSRTLQT